MNFLPKPKCNQKKLLKQRSYEKFVRKNVDEIDTRGRKGEREEKRGEGERGEILKLGSKSLKQNSGWKENKSKQCDLGASTKGKTKR